MGQVWTRAIGVEDTPRVRRALVVALVPVLMAVAVAGKSPDKDIKVPALWQRLPPPKPGEWLALFPEPGETFAEYRATKPSRPTATRKRVYLQPWLTRPSTDPAWVGELAKVMHAWFGHEVTTLPPGPMPARAYDAKAGRYDATALAARLIRTLPRDALLLLAVTDRDLKLKGLANALGWGALKHRVAVMSTYRLGRDKRLRRRALNLGLHEATHGLGLRHCIFYPCLMNGANSVSETDRRPMQLCPVCREKLCWNLGKEPLARYDALVPVLLDAGLKAAAERTGRARKATARVIE